MDLMNLKPESDTISVHLYHPVTGVPLTNDDGTDMVVTVYASHSKEYKIVTHEQTNKRLKAVQNGKRADFTAQDLEEATLNLLSKVTCGWEITYGGEKPKFTVSKARELYEDVFWFKEQIEGAISNSLDFIKA